MKTFHIFIPVCILFLFSCGLETVNYLNPPVSNYNTPTYTTNYDNRFFEFATNNNQDVSEDFKYLGTAIYYKIYNNYSTMTSRNSSIDSDNSSTNEAAAAKRMIDSYKYKELGTSDGIKSPLIPGTGKNKRVYIRLSNYQEKVSSGFIAQIRYRDNDDTSGAWTYLGVPLRRGNRYTFDFARKEDEVADNSAVDKNLSVTGDIKNAVPTQDDVNTTEDVEYGTFSDTDKKLWYVDLYAVAVGQDNSFTPYYSKVLHLGSVAIDATEDNN